MRPKIITLLMSLFLFCVSGLSAAADAPAEGAKTEDYRKAFDACYEAAVKGDASLLMKDISNIGVNAVIIVNALERDGHHELACTYANRLAELYEIYAKRPAKDEEMQEEQLLRCCRFCFEAVGEFRKAFDFEMRTMKWAEANKMPFHYTDLGRVAWAMHDVEESIRWYEKEVGQKDPDAGAFAGLALSLLHGRNDRKRALDVLSAGVASVLREISGCSREEFMHGGVVLAAPEKAEVDGHHEGRTYFGGPLTDFQKQRVAEKLAQGYRDVTEEQRLKLIEARKDNAVKLLGLYASVVKNPAP